jgi:hypothetical protein
VLARRVCFDDDVVASTIYLAKGLTRERTTLTSRPLEKSPADEERRGFGDRELTAHRVARGAERRERRTIPKGDVEDALAQAVAAAWTTFLAAMVGS